MAVICSLKRKQVIDVRDIGGGINGLNARGVGFIRVLYECGPPSLSVSLLKSDSKLFIKLCPHFMIY